MRGNGGRPDVRRALLALGLGEFSMHPGRSCKCATASPRSITPGCAATPALLRAHTREQAEALLAEIITSAGTD